MDEFVKSITSVLVPLIPLISIVVSVIALWITVWEKWHTRREVTSAYRSLLYSEQFKGSSAVFSALYRLHQRTLAAALQEPAEAKSATAGEYAKFNETVMEHDIFLPLDVVDALEDYRQAYQWVTGQQVNRSYDVDTVFTTVEDRPKMLETRYGEAVYSVRRALGTDPLTEAGLRLFGGRGESAASRRSRRQRAYWEPFVRTSTDSTSPEGGPGRGH